MMDERERALLCFPTNYENWTVLTKMFAIF